MLLVCVHVFVSPLVLKTETLLGLLSSILYHCNQHLLPFYSLSVKDSIVARYQYYHCSIHKLH